MICQVSTVSPSWGPRESQHHPSYLFIRGSIEAQRGELTLSSSPCPLGSGKTLCNFAPHSDLPSPVPRVPARGRPRSTEPQQEEVDTTSAHTSHIQGPFSEWWSWTGPPARGLSWAYRGRESRCTLGFCCFAEVALPTCCLGRGARGPFFVCFLGGSKSKCTCSVTPTQKSILHFFLREVNASSEVFEDTQTCFIILLLAITTWSISGQQLHSWNRSCNSDLNFHLSNHRFIHLCDSVVRDALIV